MNRTVLPLAALIAAVAMSVPADAGSPVSARITGFELLQVNQEVRQVAPGGSHPLCQAIPITAMRARLRWAHARAGTRVRATFTPPGLRARHRTVRLAHGAGTMKVEFTPVTEHLPHGAFAGGRYTVAFSAGGHALTRAALTLTHAVKTC